MTLRRACTTEWRQAARIGAVRVCARLFEHVFHYREVPVEAGQVKWCPAATGTALNLGRGNERWWRHQQLDNVDVAALTRHRQRRAIALRASARLVLQLARCHS